ncbi:hypothetical protein IV494_00035 [Kaistella sp. G5-32]|uniref:Uncharacterized protein n=1 Tax=Kaistella gelatinilytica TaxID=2787636 RepID=A0ABS0F774_9FLAO|nr:hypothetical protein [Kaistella gelatinilytica]MBF8455556.1 hypothetical protein [Kaistella gelatinilytica]
MDTKIAAVPQSKQITYAIEAHSNIPIILYINDIKVSELNTPLNSTIDINPYILQNGTYKIKLVLNPVFRTADLTLSPNDINSVKLSFGSYFRNKKTDDISDYKMDKVLSINAPEGDVPYFEQEWELQVNDLPYQVEGWSKGQDLSKIDKKVLESKVVSFYEKLRTILNNGDGKSYDKLWTQADKELPLYNYSGIDQIAKLKSVTIDDVENNCKDTMVPLEDYELKLYGGGKLVALERKNHTMSFNNKSPLDIKGWSPLISKGELSGAADYPILLYLPQASRDFVIIRK